MAQRTSATLQARHEFSSTLQSALSVSDVGEAFMSTVTKVLPADAYAIYRFGPESTSPIDVLADADSKFLKAYEDYGRADDPVLRFVLQQRRPIGNAGAAAPARWEASKVRAVLRGAGLDHSLQAPVIASGAIIGTINFARRSKRPNFGCRELASACQISEQLGLAFERVLRFERISRRTSMLERVLDRVPHGVIVTDLDAQVLFRNRAARNRGMVASEAIAESASDPVASAIADAVGKFKDGMRTRTRSVTDPVSQRRVVVKSYLLDSVVAVSLVYDCEALDDNRRLPTWHVLSPREQEIARFVSEGLTTTQIAARAFITENTVKQHLKRMFAKTNVRNRAELVQLIWASREDPSQL